MLLAAVARAFDRPLVRLAAAENEAERGLAATLVDALGNMLTVQALRQSNGVLGLVRRRLEAVYVPLRRSIVLNELKWCSTDVLCQALCCALLVVYVWLQWRGSDAGAPGRTMAVLLPLGSVFMVWEYARQAVTVVNNVAMHSQELSRQRSDYAAGDDIRSAMLPALPAARAVEWHQVEVRGLSFSHHGTPQRTPLNRIDLSLRRGRRYAVVGPSGSGKSTLLRVLAGVYAADTIALRQDDVELTSPAAAAAFFRSEATLLPQETHLFAATIGENLRLATTLSGGPAARDLAAALYVAGADDFTGASPAELAVRVAERGSNFSGGQRQRIALAQAVLAAEGSSVLLLDEPTSGLDAATETRVYERLFAAFPDACIVCSIHHLAVLARFDEVIALDHGTLRTQVQADRFSHALAQEIRRAS